MPRCLHPYNACDGRLHPVGDKCLYTASDVPEHMHICVRMHCFSEDAMRPLSFDMAGEQYGAATSLHELQYMFSSSIQFCVPLGKLCLHSPPSAKTHS